MSDHKPKFSVVIPTCNRPDRVKNAIKSVLEQTFQDFEIIVVDDGMKERAEKVIKEFNDPRIRYIQHETNKGGSAARNTGIKNARADWVAFLDDDDEWLSEKLAKQWQAIEKHSNEIDFVFGGIEFRDEKTGEKKIKNPSFNGVISLYPGILTYQNKPMTSSLVARKSVLEEVGGFDEALSSNQETELMIRVSNKRKGYAFCEPLAVMYLHESDHIGGNLKRRIQGREAVLKKHFDEIAKDKKALAWHYSQLGDLYREYKDSKQAKIYYIKSWIKNPAAVKNLAKIILSL